MSKTFSKLRIFGFKKFVTRSVLGELQLNCIINSKPSKSLPDTGAQVSIINKDKLESNFSDVLIQGIIFILDTCDSLRVQWGDEENIPFVG